MSQHSDKLGKYGILRLNFLKANRPELYAQLLTNGELSSHLSDVNNRSTIAVQAIFAELLRLNTPPDKTRNPGKWTQHMNTVKHQAEEVVCREIIYV